MPTPEIIEIHFGDVFRYRESTRHSGWVIVDTQAPLNRQFFFACPIMKTPDDEEMLGLPSTDSVNSIEQITSRWDPERVFGAYGRGWRYNFPSSSQQRIKEIIDNLRERAERNPKNLLTRG